MRKTRFLNLKFWYIPCIILLLVAEEGRAQFASATLYLNGLTCSLCSNGIERAVERLDFVETVQMNLNDNIATVVFRQDKKVVIEALVDKVLDAGFSLRLLEVDFLFHQVHVKEGCAFIWEGDEYIFVGVSETILEGEHKIKFIGRKMMQPQAYLKWKKQLQAHAKPSGKNQTYFITL